MKKSELIEQMAIAAGINKAAAKKSLNGFMDAVTKSLKEGDNVTLVGFGTFSVVERAARQGRNPRTGSTIKISARKIARFKPGGKLSNAIGGPHGPGGGDDE